MWFQVTVLGRDKQKGSLRDLLAVSPSGYLGCELHSQAQHQCQHSNKSFPDIAEFILSKCLTLVFTIFKVRVFCLWVLPLYPLRSHQRCFLEPALFPQLTAQVFPKEGWHQALGHTAGGQDSCWCCSLSGEVSALQVHRLHWGTCLNH